MYPYFLQDRPPRFKLFILPTGFKEPISRPFCHTVHCHCLTCGKVLAVMWQMGELERNFMIMQTSSGAGENIIGD